jgi:hypothetical protein
MYTLLCSKPMIQTIQANYSDENFTIVLISHFEIMVHNKFYDIM